MLYKNALSAKKARPPTRPKPTSSGTNGKVAVKKLNTCVNIKKEKTDEVFTIPSFDPIFNN